MKKKSGKGTEQNGKKKEEKKKGDDASVKKKEKKVYELPGQKRDPPEEVHFPFFRLHLIDNYICGYYMLLWRYHMNFSLEQMLAYIFLNLFKAHFGMFRSFCLWWKLMKLYDFEPYRETH